MISKIGLYQNYSMAFKGKSTRNLCSENKDCGSSLKTEERKVCSKKSYFKNKKPEYDTDKLLEGMHGRTGKLPGTIAPLCTLICLYMENRMDAEEFTKRHLDSVSVLYKRCEYGSKSEEFIKNYKPEIELINDITFACSAYKSAKSDNKELDEAIVSGVKKYLDKDIKRDKHFLM